MWVEFFDACSGDVTTLTACGGAGSINHRRSRTKVEGEARKTACTGAQLDNEKSPVPRHLIHFSRPNKRHVQLANRLQKPDW
jgi:hypothetical protein